MNENWETLVRKREGYERLLEVIMNQLPKTAARTGDRVLVVNPTILHESRRTIIANFTDITKALNRKPQHLARFIFKESGKPGTLEGERLVLQGKMSNEEFKRLLGLYVKEFVKCPVCGGLDTKIVAEKRFRFLVCEVCGAKSSIRKI